MNRPVGLDAYGIDLHAGRIVNPDIQGSDRDRTRMVKKLIRIEISTS